MRFFVIIGRNKLYTYEKEGTKFKLQYIDGSERFIVNTSNIVEDVETYLNVLANEKNLETKEKLEFDVLEGSDQFNSAKIIGVLEKYIKKRYSLYDVLKVIIRKLSEDEKLMINEWGINYDGYSYKNVNGRFEQGDFDLLAYTIHCNDVIDLLNIN